MWVYTPKSRCVGEVYRSVEVKQNTENENKEQKESKNRNREKKDKREYSKDMLGM